MMKPISLIFTGLTVALALPAYADFGVGQRVPAPTAAGQSVTSTPTAPFTWTPVTLPYGLNGTGQMAVGGTVDATTRLSVNPQGTGENGLTVNMPTSSTGNALTVKTPGGLTLPLINASGIFTTQPSQIGTNLWQFTPLATEADGGGTGGISAAYAKLAPDSGLVGDARFESLFIRGGRSLHLSGHDYIVCDSNLVLNNGLTTPSGLSIGAGGQAFSVQSHTFALQSDYANTVLIAGGAGLNTTLKTYDSTRSVVIQGQSGQTADLLDLNDSTNAVRAKVDSNFKATFAGLSTTGSAVSTLAGGLSNTGYHSITALATPTAPTFATATTGGTLPASTTEYYRIVAVSGTGTTIGSVEASIATGAGTATNTITLTWTAVTGAESYKVYGRTTGAELLIVSGVTALTYTDTGSITPAGALPTTNTTGYVNSILYQANGTPGVTTTLADGSAVTGGIVTAPGTTIVGNGSQVAVGGTVDATTRLSVNPQGTAENGLTVKMPSGGTGNAFQVKNSTGTILSSINAAGVLTVTGYAFAVRTVTASDNSTQTDNVLLCNGTFTESISTLYPAGYCLTIKNMGTGTITVMVNGGHGYIDGTYGSITLATQYQSRIIMFTGSTYVIIGGYL